MATKFVVNVSAADDGIAFLPGEKRTSLLRLGKYLLSLLAGARRGTHTIDARWACNAATGTLTLSSASGTVGGIINGVTITVTAAGGDTATAAAIAAAINASSNTLIRNIVVATSSGAVVTVTAAVAGFAGNCVTLAATGTGVTASGARLTLGGEFQTTFQF